MRLIRDRTNFSGVRARRMNRIYDTSKADLIKVISSEDPSSFRHYREALFFKKRTREFFLVGYGNPASKYADFGRHGITSGEDVTPISLNEAMMWGDQWLSRNEFWNVFGRHGGSDELTGTCGNLSEVSNIIRELLGRPLKRA